MANLIKFSLSESELISEEATSNRFEKSPSWFDSLDTGTPAKIPFSAILSTKTDALIGTLTVNSLKKELFLTSKPSKLFNLL